MTAASVENYGNSLRLLPVLRPRHPRACTPCRVEFLMPRPLILVLRHPTFPRGYTCLSVRGLLSSAIKRISLFVLGIQRLDEGCPLTQFPENAHRCLTRREVYLIACDCSCQGDRFIVNVSMEVLRINQRQMMLKWVLCIISQRSLLFLYVSTSGIG